MPRRATGPIAALLASLSAAWLPATSSQASSDRELGQYLSAECVTCHQVSGHHDGIPPIIGWPEPSFVQIMNEYRSKDRQNSVMQTIAGRLSQDEIAALAAYFGSLQPSSPPTPDRKRKRGKS